MDNSFLFRQDSVPVFDPSDLHGSAEERSKKMVLAYGAVFDSIILSLGLTHDTAVLPLRSSSMYASCCDGTLDLTPERLFTPFAVPFVVIKRLFPIAEQLRLTVASLQRLGAPPDPAAPPALDTVELFKHKVIQFMRCYAVVARYCPKFYLASLFEWLIAQCVELSALLTMTRACVATSGPLSFPHVTAACTSVQGSVAFVLCFIRGSHFDTLLANDYEQGLKYVLEPSTSSGIDSGVDALSETMEGLKAQLVRLEQQEDLYTRCARVELGGSATGSGPVQSSSPSGGTSFAADAAGGTRLLRATIDLLRDTSWNTVRALCTSPKRVPDLDTVVAPLFRVFQAVGREMDLVHWAIDQDIGEVVREANLLFRTPSTATRLLRTVFFNPDGTEYLKQLIYPVLKRLAKQKIPVELDPFRLPFDIEAAQRTELLATNAKVLLQAASDILQNALKTIDQVPLPIRKFLLYARNTFMSAKHLRGMVDEEGSTRLVLTSLYFLRFLCPAIVTPHTFGVFEEAPTMEVQRSLILLGKVLQCTASGVEFDGTKEEYMCCCNSFVTSNQVNIGKLYSALVDAQAIGTRELKLREKAAKAKAKANKRDGLRLLQEEFEHKVSLLRDCALTVNEFGLKQSFLPMYRSGGADEESVKTVRSLIKLDVKLHDQRLSTRAEHILSNALKANTPFAVTLQHCCGEFAEYLPNDLVVFASNEYSDGSTVVGNQTYAAYSDTATTVGVLTHPLLLLDCVTAHRPSRLAAVARMLRSSCQEVWEAGIALRDLCEGAASNRDFAVVLDQETPAGSAVDGVVGPDGRRGSSATDPSGELSDVSSVDADEESDSDTQSVAAAHAAPQGNDNNRLAVPMKEGNRLSRGKHSGSSLLKKLRERASSFDGGAAAAAAAAAAAEDKASSPATASDGSVVRNSLSGLIGTTRGSSIGTSGTSASRTPSILSLTPFASPTTLRKRKAFKKRGVGGLGNDETNLWAAALVLPQVLGLLHFLTVLRHTLKHARLENRAVLETPDVDSVLANVIFEYSKLAKQAGLQLLALTVADPTNPEIGALGLGIANAGVLVTRSALQLMNIDRQVLRRSERKSKSDKKKDLSLDQGDSESGVGDKDLPTLLTTDRSPRRPGSTTGTPRQRRKQRLTKTNKTANLRDDSPEPMGRENPLAFVVPRGAEEAEESDL